MTSATHQMIRSAIEELVALSSTANHDDLPLLAQMHEACELISGTGGPETSDIATVVVERAKSIAANLEAVILGTADDPEVAMASVGQAIADMAKCYDNDEQNKEHSAETNELCDDEVAAKLTNIFDDEVPAETVTSSDQPSAVQNGGSSDEQTVQEDISDDSNATLGSEETVPKENSEPGFEQQPLVVPESELEFLKVFMEEAVEHLEAIETAILDVEQNPTDSTKIDDLFRPFHTIKGGAGFLNLRDVQALAHEAETLLDQGRKGEREITRGLIDLLLDVLDILKVQFGSVQSYLDDPSGESIPQPPVSEMIDRLRAMVAGRDDAPSPDVITAGPNKKIGENLVAQGAVTKEVVDFVLDEQENGNIKQKTGEALVASKAVTPRQVTQALRAQSPAPAGKSGGLVDHSIRIDTGKLDSLIDMVGELVIAQAQVSANSVIAHDPVLLKNVGLADKIVRDVQEHAMGMRMVPIGATFQRMTRLVRDVSRKAGKEVDLVISGEETELDKNVIEQISDPLVHMIRNSVDHGVEPPEVREAAGKPARGQVHLSAFHHGGNIVIEIKDDGRGLDPAKLKAKAIEKEIIQPQDELSEQQAFQLIFAPGFSTAAEVTAISGRGVGMDVVRRNLEQLRGSVDITSKLGEGSTFSIRLPLTLAIIDGMIVRVGSERLIIQTVGVEQALRPTSDQITTVQHKGQVLNVRGNLAPMIQLGTLFGFGKEIDPCEAMVVLAQCPTGRVGLVVDELLGQQQVVIKSLGKRFEKLRGVSGAAVLGDGRVGLILDVAGVEEAYNSMRVLSDKAGAGQPFNDDVATDNCAESVLAGNGV